MASRKALSHKRSSSSIWSDDSLSSTSSHQSYETEATDFSTHILSRTPSVICKAPYHPLSTPDYVACKPALKVILGTASLGSAKSNMGKISTVDDASKFVQQFRSRGYSDIDTARNYPVGRPGTCEKLLGERRVGIATANVSTKVLSFAAGSHKIQSIHANIDRSLRALNIPTLDIVYLHAPDRATSFEEACRAMDIAYRAGKFERFGISNYTVDDIEEIMKICEQNSFIRPSVYQGQYNLLCRSAERDLFRVLRKYKIAFYAYSPAASGFLSGKTSRNSVHDASSRWYKQVPLGQKYAADYFHEELFSAATVIKEYAALFRVSGHAAALRWITWHSQLDAQLGDALIVGASSQQQLKDSLDALEQGPLPDALVEVIEDVWRDLNGLDIGPTFSLFN
jgi:aflatoxin B1 aldehyde reductase